MILPLCKAPSMQQALEHLLFLKELIRLVHHFISRAESLTKDKGPFSPALMETPSLSFQIVEQITSLFPGSHSTTVKLELKETAKFQRTFILRTTRSRTLLLTRPIGHLKRPSLARTG